MRLRRRVIELEGVMAEALDGLSGPQALRNYRTDRAAVVLRQTLAAPAKGPADD